LVGLFKKWAGRAALKNIFHEAFFEIKSVCLADGKGDNLKRK
jgi:hypothetical protein